ncbi:serine hydrolase domain-containing protein [Shouchella patagoniensis]|uniref:serine hydrolase domain-containing protein n=1 Tax=Shouchella patagoniensis TaxID=228576 RepID=UPI001FE5B90B|nr:serine hydrolase domain-containing protein [Shouchella patagoniensis]
MRKSFDQVTKHVEATAKKVEQSGSALIIMHNGETVLEKYWGRHSNSENARKVQANTRFHVASVRKSYIGFAVAYAVYKGYISSINDLVIRYLPEWNQPIMEGTTIRHLLTHTHGLREREGNIARDFLPGTSWAYRGVGIGMLAEIVKRTTGQTVSEILATQVFIPLHYYESGWIGKKDETLVEVIRKENDSAWTESLSTEGDQMNMYVSARELARWGELHRTKGFINGNQHISKEIFQMTTSLQSPDLVNGDLPQNGFLWFVKDKEVAKSEIGALVPRGSYQILGYTGVTVLVIPDYQLVTVRAFNSFGSPEGFDYLSDVRDFGDAVVTAYKTNDVHA